MAAMAPVDLAHYTEPSEGKVLLIADAEGMFRSDAALLREINLIGDLTVSALPDHYPVKKGMRLASMRIVPLVTKEEQVIRAEKMCEGKKLIDLLPYRSMKAGIVITGSEIFRGRVRDRFEPVARKKLSGYPCEVVGVRICDDDTDMLVSAARELITAGADLLVFSGGMSVDPDDVTPAAIRALGCRVVTHGVPSQPGNMTLMAYMGEIPVIGVPGAAISLPTTIFDAMLPQIFAGVPFDKEDLVRLGDGGLCQLCAACHFPNCTFGRY